jgi:8-oxo-dGTP pyrophosphatase MutT (NUDIX family)
MINKINKFFEFEPFESKMKKSAGVIIVLKNEKVLICHPSNNDKWFGSYSFPKGGIDEGETIKQAALRELFEETSVKLDESKISKEPLVLDYMNYKKKDVVYKKIYLFTMYINDISEIGLDSEVIPSDKLPFGEIDWAGFISKEEAKLRLFHRSVPVIDKI